MTLAIMGMARDSNGKIYYGFGSEPAFTTYIDQVFPKGVKIVYDYENNWYVLDIDNIDYALITAKPYIELPNTNEKINFSYFLVTREGETIKHFFNSLGVTKGQDGIAVISFGFPVPISVLEKWPKPSKFVDIVEFNNWVNKTIKHPSFLSNFEIRLPEPILS